MTDPEEISTMGTLVSDENATTKAIEPNNVESNEALLNNDHDKLLSSESLKTSSTIPADNEEVKQDNSLSQSEEVKEPTEQSHETTANSSSTPITFGSKFSKNAKKNARKNAKRKEAASASQVDDGSSTSTASSPDPTSLSDPSSSSFSATTVDSKKNDTESVRLNDEEVRLLWRLEGLERGTIALTEKDEDAIALNAKAEYDLHLRALFAEKDPRKRELLMLKQLQESSESSMRNLRKAYLWEEKYKRANRLRDHSHSLAVEATGKVESLLLATQTLEARSKESLALERKRFDDIIIDIQQKMAVFTDMEKKLSEENRDLRTKSIAILDEDKHKSEQIRALRQQMALEKKVMEREITSKTMLCEEQTRMAELSNRQIAQLTELKGLYEKNIAEHKKRNDELQAAVLGNKKNNDKYAEALKKMRKDVDDVIKVNKGLRTDLNLQRELAEKRLAEKLKLERDIGTITYRLEAARKKYDDLVKSSGTLNTPAEISKEMAEENKKAADGNDV